MSTTQMLGLQELDPKYTRAIWEKTDLSELHMQESVLVKRTALDAFG